MAANEQCFKKGDVYGMFRARIKLLLGINVKTKSNGNKNDAKLGLGKKMSVSLNTTVTWMESLKWTEMEPAIDWSGKGHIYAVGIMNSPVRLKV